MAVVKLLPPHVTSAICPTLTDLTVAMSKRTALADRSVPRESRGRDLVRAIAALTSAELPLRELFGKLAAALIDAFGGAIVVIATATQEGTRIEYAYREGAP